MKRTGIGRHSIEFYDSIDDMPIERYQKFNKYLLVDSGVGSDIKDFDTHIEKVVRFLANNDNDSANIELQNMRQNVYLVQQELSPKYMAFCCLVTRIGNKDIKCTDEDIKYVYDVLKDVRMKEAEKVLAEIKKKVNDELTLFFPSLFDNAKEKEYYDLLKKLTEAKLSRIQGKDVDVSEIETRMLTLAKPQSFVGLKSVEVAFAKEHERLCLLISSELHADAKKMTVKEYYTAYEILKERNEQLEKLNSHGRK